MAAVGVAAHGVVAVEPSEGLAAAGGLVGPGALVHEDLALERGAHRLGRCACRAGADCSHGLGHLELLAGGGEGLGGVDRSVVGVEGGPLSSPLRVAAARWSASMTGDVRMWSRGARPTGRRLQQSMTVAGCRFPSAAGGRWVMSPTHLRLGAGAVKSRSSGSGRLAPAWSGTVVRTGRRRRWPQMPAARIRRATRSRFTRPSACSAAPLSSAVILGEPLVGGRVQWSV